MLRVVVCCGLVDQEWTTAHLPFWVVREDSCLTRLKSQTIRKRSFEVM